MSIPKAKRNKELVKLRRKGYSFGELGKRFGVSKQCAWMIYQNPKWQDHSFISRLLARLGQAGLFHLFSPFKRRE